MGSRGEFFKQIFCCDAIYSASAKDTGFLPLFCFVARGSTDITVYWLAMKNGDERTEIMYERKG
jgi:hypothetical protein